MAITAKHRARLQLRADTRLDPTSALAIVKAATGTVKGGGAKVQINGEAASRLQLSITSGKRLIRLCTFSAEVVSEGGRTQLRVGGLETYRTNQAHFFYVIPAGPKAIAGMD